MAKVMAGMSVSLDGFINDGNGSVDPLYTDFNELHHVPTFKKMIEETGAVIMGRKTYEMADPFSWVNEEYEFQVPLFVLTHNPPVTYPKGNDKLSVTFVTEGIESAISQAKQAAGEKMVQIIGGADTIQQALNSGLCDELQLDLMPVILGNGRRLFEHIKTDKIQLERVKVEELTSQRTNLIFRLVK